MPPIITVENLSKKYIIGHQQERRYVALRDVLAERAGALARTLSFKKRDVKDKFAATEEFWALKDINFEVNKGDRLGIIGRNGAGKSTLLKVLSKITEPSTGRITLHGRVASLLEVGTGFHPELTGRENVFMNGVILGMTRNEIKKKFDEIVAFAEVEKFLDTPVKRYSSGMYVRLAFAVAVHLNSEILLIDEVLAVGDVEFQKKCLAKMEEITSGGRTVLLVSHNMSTILALSTRCLLLSKGSLVEHGPARDVVGIYQKGITGGSLDNTDLREHDRYGTGRGKFMSIAIHAHDKTGKNLGIPTTGCDLVFEIGVVASEDIVSANVALILYDDLGNRIVDANTLLKGECLSLNAGKKAKVTFRLKNVRLRPGTYSAGLWLGIANVGDFDGIQCATSFQMEAEREDILYAEPFPGVYACEFEHKIAFLQ